MKQKSSPQKKFNFFLNFFFRQKPSKTSLKNKHEIVKSKKKRTQVLVVLNMLIFTIQSNSRVKISKIKMTPFFNGVRTSGQNLTP